jgi:hypothetical protein
MKKKTKIQMKMAKGWLGWWPGHVSTSTVDTWWAVNIWMENVTNVPNEFLPLTHVLFMKQIKTQVLNLKNLKLKYQ